jgi:hypothetical protein
LSELRFDGDDHVVQPWEISVVQATAPRQLPNSLDRIQLGTVGRQIVENKVPGVFFSPPFVKPSVVVFGIVGDDNHAAPCSDARSPQAFHELEKGRAVELVCLTAKLKLSIPQSHSGKVSYAVPRWRVQQDRVLGFRRNPHLTP